MALGKLCKFICIFFMIEIPVLSFYIKYLVNTESVIRIQCSVKFVLSVVQAEYL